MNGSSYLAENDADFLMYRALINRAFPHCQLVRLDLPSACLSLMVAVVWSSTLDPWPEPLLWRERCSPELQWRDSRSTLLFFLALSWLALSSLTGWWFTQSTHKRFDLHFFPDHNKQRTFQTCAQKDVNIFQMLIYIFKLICRL